MSSVSRFRRVRGGEGAMVVDVAVPSGPDSPHPSDLVAVSPSYTTALGAMYTADARDALASVPAGSVSLAVTSPPYALEFKKEYGNAAKDEYVEWMRPFAEQIFRVLGDD